MGMRALHLGMTVGISTRAGRGSPAQWPHMDFRCGEGAAFVMMAVGGNVKLAVGEAGVVVSLAPGEMIVAKANLVHYGPCYNAAQETDNAHLRLHAVMHWKGEQKTDDVSGIHCMEVRAACLPGYRRAMFCFHMHYVKCALFICTCVCMRCAGL